MTGTRASLLRPEARGSASTLRFGPAITIRVPRFP
jgi:hypothetical protein